MAAALAFSLLPATVSAQTVSGTIDLLEMHLGKGNDHLIIDSAFRLGDDVQGVALRLEGGSDLGPYLDEVTAQLLYTRNLLPNTAVSAGVRQDFREGSDLRYGVFAIETAIGQIAGAEHFLFVSEDGDVTGAAMVVVGLPLGATTIEPRLAVGWSAQAVLDEEIGAGVSDVELSLRLRRAVGPLFNVYVGAIHEQLLGDTRDIARANGDSGEVTRAVIGAGLQF